MEESPYTGPERRKYQRLEETLPVAFKVIDGKTPVPYHGITKNIGAGGIFLKIPLLIEKDSMLIGDKLELEINLPTVHEPVRAVGEIRWVEPKKPKQAYKFAVGIKFAEISDQERDKIKNFVEVRLQAGEL